MRILTVRFLVLVLLVLAAGDVRSQQGAMPVGPGLPTMISAGQDKTERVEIAEGEYSIFKQYGGVGPIEAEIFNFHETWTLWRTYAGDYEVEGTRSFESPKDSPREIRFWLHLSSELQLIEAKEYTPLIWIRRSGPLACTFSPKTLQCSANGKDPSSNPDFSLSMDRPYAFSWPLSVFSLAALARQADRHAGQVTEIELVEIGQPSPSNPIMPITTSGKIRFLGREAIAVAGRDWQAEKFELDTFMLSLPRTSLLWISANGLLLQVEAQPENGPKGMLQLTRFEERAPLDTVR